MADTPPFVYVTYMRSTPEKVWHALADADTTGEWWGHNNVSDWQVGSTWEHRRADGSGIVVGVGTVLESNEPERLKMTFPTDVTTELTFEIESYRDTVRLTVTHGNLAGQGAYNMAADVWIAVLSNLKSLIETGHALPQAPLEMLWALDT
jgi:uncharacterized protein YndB with AHSA1/START domain